MRCTAPHRAVQFMFDPRAHISGPRSSLQRTSVPEARHDSTPQRGILRAGVAGAWLPHRRLDVPHIPLSSLDAAVATCTAMALRAQGLTIDPEALNDILQRVGESPAGGCRLTRLRAWGAEVRMPDALSDLREATAVVNRRMSVPGARLVFRWEEGWLRWVRRSLGEGLPVLAFTQAQVLYPIWRGLRLPHAVVICGGEGRRAWIQDPARTDGPVRIGLSRLMDSLSPGQPLAAVVQSTASLEQAMRARARDA